MKYVKFFRWGVDIVIGCKGCSEDGSRRYETIGFQFKRDRWLETFPNSKGLPWCEHWSYDGRKKFAIRLLGYVFAIGEDYYDEP